MQQPNAVRGVVRSFRVSRDTEPGGILQRLNGHQPFGPTRPLPGRFPGGLPVKRRQGSVRRPITPTSGENGYGPAQHRPDRKRR
jgi:hypothetical protein